MRGRAARRADPTRPRRQAGESRRDRGVARDRQNAGWILLRVSRVAVPRYGGGTRPTTPLQGCVTFPRRQHPAPRVLGAGWRMGPAVGQRADYGGLATSRSKRDGARRGGPSARQLVLPRDRDPRDSLRRPRRGAHSWHLAEVGNDLDFQLQAGDTRHAVLTMSDAVAERSDSTQDNGCRALDARHPLPAAS